MRILINAGPTQESLDPVRFITNHSTGRMGYALAASAVRAGHSVILVSGPVTLTPPENLAKFIPVVTAAEMADVMKHEYCEVDLTILCAAVADYRPKRYSDTKIKKMDGGMYLELERTEDIAFTLGQLKRPGQLLAGFAAETDNVESNALKKLKAKNFDWIAANKVGVAGSGFGSETNTVKLYAADGSMMDLGSDLKTKLAERLIDIFTKRQD